MEELSVCKPRVPMKNATHRVTSKSHRQWGEGSDQVLGLAIAGLHYTRVRIPNDVLKAPDGVGKCSDSPNDGGVRGKRTFFPISRNTLES